MVAIAFLDFDKITRVLGIFTPIIVAMILLVTGYTFFNLKNLNYPLKSKGDKIGDKIGDKREKIYSMIAADPKVSLREIAERLGVSKKQVESAVAFLKKSGRLKRQGSSRGGSWEVF